MHTTEKNFSEGRLSGTPLLLEQAVKLTYYWVYELLGDFIARELKIGSDHTIVNCNFVREACLCILRQDSERIGGPGKQVEIDESKFENASTTVARK